MRQWLIFIYLGCVAWGTSFLWIKVALQELGPITLVGWRFLFGLVTVALSVVILKHRIVFRGLRFWLPAGLGVLGGAIPIVLISWAEQSIDSGLAGVLNSTMPIWTMLIAHFALHDDRMTPGRLTGLVTGFVGIYILLDPRGSATHDLVGQLAVVAAAIFYATATVLQHRHLSGVHPLQSSLPAMLGATVVLAITAAIVEGPLSLPKEPMTWLACAWMGIIGMGLAVQAWYHLINHWGATRTSLVTYVFPVAAVALGVVILDERLTWELVVGGVLIIGGIALVNRKAEDRVSEPVTG